MLSHGAFSRLGLRVREDQNRPLLPLAVGEYGDERVGLVYWIGAENGSPVKIGWTAGESALQRLRKLQPGCWERLVVLGAIPGRRYDEWLAHEHLTEHRIRGEWFARAPAVRLLEDLRAEVAKDEDAG